MTVEWRISCTSNWKGKNLRCSLLWSPISPLLSMYFPISFVLGYQFPFTRVLLVITLKVDYHNMYILSSTYSTRPLVFMKGCYSKNFEIQHIIMIFWFSHCELPVTPTFCLISWKYIILAKFIITSCMGLCFVKTFQAYYIYGRRLPDIWMYLALRNNKKS